MTKSIGFIGVGMMGHGMARNLLAKGFPLTFKVNRNRSNLDDLFAAMMTTSMLNDGDLGGFKFAIANAQKDLRYFTHLAEMLPVSSFMGEAAHQSFVQAANLGFGDKLIASLFEAQEKINAVKIVPR